MFLSFARTALSVILDKAIILTFHIVNALFSETMKTQWELQDFKSGFSSSWSEPALSSVIVLSSAEQRDLSVWACLAMSWDFLVPNILDLCF